MENNIKLVCFDLDQTLIEQNSWYKLNLGLGVTADEDKGLFEKYIKDKFSYKEWNQELLKLFKERNKANKTNITNILSEYTLKDGAREIIEYLKQKGYIVAIISGSIDILVDIVAKDLGVKYRRACNKFVFDDQDMLESIITDEKDSIHKVVILQSICEESDIRMNECVCIGDGSNDLPLFVETGHGITFKSSVIEADAWKIINNLLEVKEIL